MSNKYDPNVKYGWDNETQFLLNGSEFGLILNTFRTVLNTAEAKKILLLNNANNSTEDILQRNVESGTLKPQITEPEPQKSIADMQVLDADEVVEDNK